MKICNKCGRELDESMFYKNSKNKDGLAYDCKDCRKTYMNIDYAERNKQRAKIYAENNKEKIQQANRLYYQKHKEQIREAKGRYYREHREYYKELNRQYAKKNEQYYKNYEKDYRIRRQELWDKNKLDLNLHKSLTKSLSSNSPNNYWCYQVLDFTIEQLKEHLESQFTPEMNWNNYGEYWEIDHIIPKNQLKFTSYDDKEFKICWSLVNLRPIEITANRSRPRDGSDIPQEIKNQILQFNRERR